MSAVAELGGCPGPQAPGDVPMGVTEAAECERDSISLGLSRPLGSPWDQRHARPRGTHGKGRNPFLLILSLLKTLTFCSSWVFCINFDFLKYCTKISYTLTTEILGTSLNSVP